MPTKRRRSTLLLALFGAVSAAAGCGADVVASAGPPRHLLLITVDTLRADHLGCYGYERATSPAIDRLAADSVLFERAYSSSSWTLPALASLMTSYYTSTHGCSGDDSGLPEEFDTLAEILSNEGFATGAVVNHFYLDSRFGLHQGFDDYDKELLTDTMRASHETITSPQVTEKAIAWLEARMAEADDARLFLWLHYFDPHDRYLHHEGVSEHFARQSPWGNSYADMDRYDGEIAFTDASIGDLLDGLEALDMADDTLVVLVADHGEEFGEHGGTSHRNNLHRETVQIPLLLRVPGLAPGRIEHPVSILDVMPTVLEVLGAPVPPEVAGQSLLPTILRGRHDHERSFLAELYHRQIQLASIQQGRWRLIHDQRSGRHELYDIEADPAEQRDLAAEEPDVAARLQAALTEELAEARRLGASNGKSRRIDLSPSDLRRIQDLGYAGDSY